MNKPITVTQPCLPPWKNLYPSQQIWQNKWLTNNGLFISSWKKELAEYMGVKYISVFPMNIGTASQP
jgi:dTDP-4-amino-4,6-dideoxygalactose transaminase